QGPVAARRPGAVRRFLRDRTRVTALAMVLVVALCTLGFLCWPRGRFVVFAANVDPMAAELGLGEGTTVFLDDPVWLPLGPHRATLRPARGSALRPVAREFEVTAGSGRQRVNLVTMDQLLAGGMGPPGRVPVQFMTGHNQTALAPGLPLDQRFIDGVRIDDWSPYTREGLLPPGEYTFRAVDGKGREEVQRVRIGDAPVDLQMLPAWMAAIDGRYRRTWSTVLSPMPPELSWTGTGECWLGIARAAVIGGAGVQEVPCAFVPPAVGLDAVVELRCAFPEPVRSAVVRVRGLVQAGGLLEVEAGFAGEPLRRWPLVDGVLEPLQAFVSERGAGEFVLRARMATGIEPTTGRTLVRFLDGVLFGGHWRDEPPCFAIVADSTDCARSPAPVAAPDPAQARALPVVPLAVSLRGDGIMGRCIVRGPKQQRELWVAVRDERAQRAEIRRLGWPDLGERGVLRPDALHPRSQPRDGADFGESMTTTPDQDGDGWEEVAVGDPGSARLGRPNGGTVGCLASTTWEPHWLWPARDLGSEFGDDGAGRVVRAGDWNGDGHSDLVVGAFNAGSPDGTPKAGRLEVVDARTGESLWRHSGVAELTCAALTGSWTEPGSGGPAALLWVETTERANLNVSGNIQWVVRIGGAGGRDVRSPRLLHSAAVLVGSNDPVRGCCLVALRVGPWSDDFVGLERFEADGDRWVLAARQALLPPAGVAPERRSLGERDGACLSDLDGDGWQDAAFVWRMQQSVGVVFVAGNDLRILGFASLPDAVPESVSTPLWIPAEAGEPGRLLVAWTAVDAGSRVIRFATITVR
ncbi:MAG: VCBS repeat-containing protein, partial [Planctomycetota bacterium]